MTRIYTCSEALIIAQKASEYANTQILQGVTPLTNNDSEFEYFLSHKVGVENC